LQNGNFKLQIGELLVTYRKFAICILQLSICNVFLAASAPNFALADGAGPLLKLLQSGKLPPERQPTVVEMVCKKGNAEDLSYVFTQVLDPKVYPAELRLKSLGWLSDAAKINKMKPAGDLSVINQLLADGEAAKNPAFALATIRLAAEWQVPSIGKELQRVASADGVDAKLRAAAIEGLTTIGDSDSRSTLERLAATGNPTRVRFLAAAGLAGLDLPIAAKSAAAALADATAKDDPTALIQSFLDRKQGPEALAGQLESVKLSVDVAKLALRTMYAAGRSDQLLSDVLSKAAGIAVDAPPPTGDELNRIIAEVVAKGDAVRGEQVFRRADVNCMKCHSVSGGGGTIGPDLSPIGGTSPIDYVVNSILNPNLAIKELYVTKNIITSDGRTLSGIVVDRNDQQVKLKDATGTIVTVATADIDEEVEGRSLMPQGLTKFLTHDEFLDLAKFISELGKPGAFAIRKTPTVQRWRVLTAPDPQLIAEIPNIEVLRQLVLAAPPEAWAPTFAKVAGALPLDELLAKADQKVLYLQGTVEIVEPGDVGLEIACTEPLQAWLDATPFDPTQKFVTKLEKGTHTLTIRVACGDRPSPELRAEFFKPDGSTAQLAVP
jgi:putative heme-binding domain-containing protein